MMKIKIIKNVRLILVDHQQNPTFACENQITFKYVKLERILNVIPHVNYEIKKSINIYKTFLNQIMNTI